MPDLRMLAVCGFLLLAVALAFGQTVRYQFVNARRRRVPVRKSARHAWADRPSGPLGIHQPLGGQLGSAHLDFSPGWIGSSTVEAGGHHLTNILLHAATAILLFSRSTANDRPILAERYRGGALGDPSAAGGIGGLGDRTERRPQRRVLHADAGSLCELCPSSVFACPIFGGDGSLRVGTDDQADVDHVAVRPAAVGLLAAGPDEGSRDRWFAVGCSTASPMAQANGRAADDSTTTGRGFTRAYWHLVVEKLPLFVLVAACCGVTIWAQRLRRSPTVPGHGGSATQCLDTASTYDSVSVPRDWRSSICVAVPFCRFGKFLGPARFYWSSPLRFTFAGGDVPTCWSAGCGMWGC